MQHKKIAFYPCCATDFAEPYRLLCELVDEIIFCDNNPSAEKEFIKLKLSYPEATFLLQDVIIALKEINHIDIFFYRKDSNGEGGSAIYFYGDHVFPLIVNKLNKSVAHIISDGSNARGSNWRKMKRTNGVIIYDRFFKPAKEHKYAQIRGNGPVLTIDVYPVDPI